ncbi:hypothetical protein C5167_019850 [Papaver somniferum]|uniref:Reverse transcriptase domain-containing protein n=1 Tax=Papaver somniferum TaxID=3469 RepID=A0A4Y7IVJ8_PAPSO|nr:hypothetical protein C5167_019850 [Papaver somniferum]
MFGDDVMLFGNTNDTTINSITEILQHYYNVSGQLVNYNKSSIHFSKSVSDERSNEITTILGVSRMSKDDKYLGLLQQIFDPFTATQINNIQIHKEAENNEESVDHLLLHCSTAQPIWFASPLGLRLQEDHHLTLGNLVEQWLTCQDNEYSFAMGATTSWALWKARNELVFDNK